MFMYQNRQRFSRCVLEVQHLHYIEKKLTGSLKYVRKKPFISFDKKEALINLQA